MYLLEIRVPLLSANEDDYWRIRRAAVKAKNKRTIWVWKPAAEAENPLPLIIMAREASKKFPHHMERIRKLNETTRKNR